MTANPARLFLGSCFPSVFSNMTQDGAYAEFHYPLSACGFRRIVSLLHGLFDH